MGERRDRRARLLQAHPNCIFCGGNVPAVEEDHVPPRSFFVERRWPEGFSFPACEPCNRGSRVADLVCGFYVRWMDHDQKNLVDEPYMMRLFGGLKNNYPELLPIPETSPIAIRKTLKRTIVRRDPKLPLVDIPIVRMPKAALPYFSSTCRKLLCALYYKETGKPLPTSARIWHEWQHVFDKKMDEVIRLLAPVHANFVAGTRARQVGQFKYRWGTNDPEGLFSFVAQLGNSFFIVGAAITADAHDHRTDDWSTLGEKLLSASVR